MALSVEELQEALRHVPGFKANDSTRVVKENTTTGRREWQALAAADLPYVTRDIPLYVTSVSYSAGVPFMADETATDVVRVWIRVPTTWDGTTSITLKTHWLCDNTGLKDLETQVVYFADTDEAAATVVSAFTNTNLTWTGANVTKVLTTTLSSLAAGRSYRVDFRCNTGDANTGNLFLEGAYATTAVR